MFQAQQAESEANGLMDKLSVALNDVVRTLGLGVGAMGAEKSKNNEISQPYVSC